MLLLKNATKSLKFENFLKLKNLKFFYRLPSHGISSTESLNSNLEMFDEKLCELENISELKNFYSQNKNIVDSYLEKKLLFLDYYTNFASDEQIDFTRNILSEIKIENLKVLENMYILSLLESLYNLDYYPYEDSDSNCSKLWIGLEYLIIGTNFINNLSIENYGIILQAFQKFFTIKDSTISPEEIFESLEYQIIMGLKKNKIENNSGINPDQNKSLKSKFVQIFTLFGKNLEGSLELYSLLIEKYLKDRKDFSLEELVSLYFSSICINMYVCQKAKLIENFLTNIESDIENRFRKIKEIQAKNVFVSEEEKYKNHLSEASKDVLQWCFEVRNKNILL
jgi:hypothetical protein